MNSSSSTSYRPGGFLGGNGYSIAGEEEPQKSKKWVFCPERKRFVSESSLKKATAPTQLDTKEKSVESPDEEERKLREELERLQQQLREIEGAKREGNNMGTGKKKTKKIIRRKVVKKKAQGNEAAGTVPSMIQIKPEPLPVPVNSYPSVATDPTITHYRPHYASSSDPVASPKPLSPLDRIRSIAHNHDSSLPAVATSAKPVHSPEKWMLGSATKKPIQALQQQAQTKRNEWSWKNEKKAELTKKQETTPLPSSIQVNRPKENVSVVITSSPKAQSPIPSASTNQSKSSAKLEAQGANIDSGARRELLTNFFKKRSQEVSEKCTDKGETMNEKSSPNIAPLSTKNYRDPGVSIDTKKNYQTSPRVDNRQQVLTQMLQKRTTKVDTTVDHAVKQDKPETREVSAHPVPTTDGSTFNQNTRPSSPSDEDSDSCTSLSCEDVPIKSPSRNSVTTRGNIQQSPLGYVGQWQGKTDSDSGSESSKAELLNGESLSTNDSPTKRHEHESECSNADGSEAFSAREKISDSLVLPLSHEVDLNRDAFSSENESDLESSESSSSEQSTFSTLEKIRERHGNLSFSSSCSKVDLMLSRAASDSESSESSSSNGSSEAFSPEVVFDALTTDIGNEPLSGNPVVDPERDNNSTCISPPADSKAFDAEEDREIRSLFLSDTDNGEEVVSVEADSSQGAIAKPKRHWLDDSESNDSCSESNSDFNACDVFVEEIQQPVWGTTRDSNEDERIFPTATNSARSNVCFSDSDTDTSDDTSSQADDDGDKKEPSSIPTESMGPSLGLEKPSCFTSDLDNDENCTSNHTEPATSTFDGRPLEETEILVSDSDPESLSHSNNVTTRTDETKQSIDVPQNEEPNISRAEIYSSDTNEEVKPDILSAPETAATYSKEVSSASAVTDQFPGNSSKLEELRKRKQNDLEKVQSSLKHLQHEDPPVTSTPNSVKERNAYASVPHHPTNATAVYDGEVNLAMAVLSYLKYRHLDTTAARFIEEWVTVYGEIDSTQVQMGTIKWEPLLPSVSNPKLSTSDGSHTVQDQVQQSDTKPDKQDNVRRQSVLDDSGSEEEEKEVSGNRRASSNHVLQRRSVLDESDSAHSEESSSEESESSSEDSGDKDSIKNKTAPSLQRNAFARGFRRAVSFDEDQKPAEDAGSLKGPGVRRSVSFDTLELTHVIEIPRYAPEDIAELFYDRSDIHRFRFDDQVRKQQEQTEQMLSFMQSSVASATSAMPSIFD